MRGNEAATIIIQADSGEFISRLPARSNVVSLSWRPSGNQLAYTTIVGSSIFLSDIISGYRMVLSGHIEYVRSLSWSTNGAYLASASNDGTIRIWDMTNMPNLSGTPTPQP
jgi:WD40 repeat protein